MSANFRRSLVELDTVVQLIESVNFNSLLLIRN